MRSEWNTGCGLLLIAALTSVPVIAGAQSLTPVAVHGRLKADRFRRHFASAVADVERKVAKQFAAHLAREIGFLKFLVQDTVGPYRLVFTLDRRERTVLAGFPEFGFWVVLERPGSQPLELYWLRFRSAEQALDSVGTVDAFLDELEFKLTHDADVGLLRDSLLDKIPITTQALPVSTPPGWALIFPHVDLCIKNDSELRVLSVVQAGAMRLEKAVQARVAGPFQTMSQPTSETQPFVGGIFSVLGQEAIAEWTPILGQPPGTVRVKEVYVVSYIHDPTACRDRLPAGEEGGRP